MNNEPRCGSAGAIGLAALAIACSSSDMPSADMGIPFAPSAPAAYTAKVKSLLVGLPTTDDEVRAVSANPQALAGLIDGWMGLPQFQVKMRGFFQQAFQQTQITELELQDQLQANPQSWNPVDKALFLSSVTSSFPATAWEIVQSGQPFTSTVTTNTFYLNVPLMAALALNDLYVVDDSGATSTAELLARYPGFQFTRTTDSTVTLDQTLDPKSPNFMVWYDPTPYMGPAASCLTYPFTIKNPANAIREVAARMFGGRLGCPPAVKSVFSAADYASWRMVKIRPPAAGEQTTEPWNIAAFQDPSMTTLVLKTPRVGFMTTLAFLANWPTNGSNLMRVTSNQSLIVALGESLANPELAVPVSENGGSPANHAQPGTVCYGCHVVLDPITTFFRQSYSLTYHRQTSATLTPPPAFPGAEFNYGGIDVKGTGGGVTELAAALAQSPSFATAWTQKLCQFANSSSCSADDPEFLRVAGVFSASSFNFKTLVRELFSSPLVTYASVTKSAQDNGTIVSVSRREHFCTALSTRLGIQDACSLQPLKMSKIQNLASGIPGSAYSRGTPSPLLPHDPDLFFFSAVENLCEQLAAEVIDPTKPCSAPQVCWKSTDPIAGNIGAFVGTLMSLPPSDPRTAGITQTLTDHYSAALAATGSATAALQSTFVLACASPSSEASGL